MKILIVNKFLYPNGGSETYIFKIGRQLRAMGHEVQYFGMEHKGRIVGNNAGVYTKPVDFHAASKASNLTLPLKILYSNEARADIQRVLADFHPDVVHFNNINFQLTPSVIDGVRSFSPDIRMVYTAHDAQWVCPNHLLRIPSTGEICTRCIDGDVSNCRKYRCIHNSQAKSILGEMEARLYQRRGTYRQVDTIISPSAFLAGILEHNPQLRGRIVTMHNFFDTEGSSGTGQKNERTDQNTVLQYHADSGVVGRARSFSERFSPDGRYVLYFGRYTEEKGVSTLLKACRSLPGIPFIFAGRGELEQEVNSLSNVCNVGFLNSSDMRELVKNAAFVIFPSEWLENGPFSVIEAIMNGTPVLASRLGGTPELISEGETGKLFEAGNISGLTAGIRELYEDRNYLEMLHEGCLRTAAGKGSIHIDTLEEYCSKLLDIYRDQTRT